MAVCRPLCLATQTGRRFAALAKPADWLPLALPPAPPAVQVALQNNATALDLAQLLPQRWHAFLR